MMVTLPPACWGLHGSPLFSFSRRVPRAGRSILPGCWAPLHVCEETGPNADERASTAAMDLGTWRLVQTPGVAAPAKSPSRRRQTPPALMLITPPDLWRCRVCPSFTQLRPTQAIASTQLSRPQVTARVYRVKAHALALICPSTAWCSACGSPSAPSLQRASGGRPVALHVTDDTARHQRYTSRSSPRCGFWRAGLTSVRLVDHHPVCPAAE
jgi:hypothetical protein